MDYSHLIPIDSHWAIEAGHADAYMQHLAHVDYAAHLVEFKAARESGEDGSMSYQVDGNGIAEMNLSGPITKKPSSMQAYFGGASTMMFRKALLQAQNDPAVKGILVCFDSPGGQINGLSDAAATMRLVGKKKPLYGYVDDLCASAAYWLGSQCEKLYGGDMAIAGHIGVYTTLTDTSAAMKQQGVVRHLVKSAPFKGVGERGIPISDEAVAETQREVDAFHGMFEAAIALGRGMKPEKVSAVSDGRGYIGQEAVSAGLMDGVADKEAVKKKLLKRMTDGVKPQTTSQEKKTMADKSPWEEFKAMMGFGPESDEDLTAKVQDPAPVVTQTALLKADLTQDPEFVAMKAERDRLAEQERIRLLADADMATARNTEVMEAYSKEGKFTPAELVEETTLRASAPATYDALWKKRSVLPQFKDQRRTVDAEKIADAYAKGDVTAGMGALDEMMAASTRRMSGKAPKKEGE